MEKVNPNAVTVVGVAERKVKIKKVITSICSAALAMSVVAVSAFAEDGTVSAGVDYSSLITTIVDGFSTIITNCVAVAAAVIPLGLGLMGLGKMWDVAKRFFTKTTSG